MVEWNGTERLDRYARRGLWIGATNGETCFLLVVDDLDDDDDEESNFKSVIQLSDWDGRPGMSSRVFDNEDALCLNAKWLGDAHLQLKKRLKDEHPRAHVGQVYVHEKRPHLLVLDDLARLREHDLVGLFHEGDKGDGFYEWELCYRPHGDREKSLMTRKACSSTMQKRPDYCANDYDYVEDGVST